MRIDLTEQPGSWVECRAHTLAGYNQDLIHAAVTAGIGLKALQDADDPGRLGLAAAHQLALVRWQVRAWHVCDDDGQWLPAPREVGLEDLALVPEAVLAEILKAVDTARTGEPAAAPIADPSGPGSSSGS